MRRLLPSTYGIREYQNKANTTNEFTYDANGNMVKDLDRNIVTIRYNFLNLPDTVQFGNGNQIVNRYDASGQKLSTRYFTSLVPVVVNPGQTKQWTYTANIISDIGIYYVGNREYKFNGSTPAIYTIDKIYNVEPQKKNNRLLFFIKKNIGYYYWIDKRYLECEDELNDQTIKRDSIVNKFGFKY